MKELLEQIIKKLNYYFPEVKENINSIVKSPLTKELDQKDWDEIKEKYKEDYDDENDLKGKIKKAYFVYYNARTIAACLWAVNNNTDVGYSYEEIFDMYTNMIKKSR